jgi:hypothetical protein
MRMEVGEMTGKLLAIFLVSWLFTSCGRKPAYRAPEPIRVFIAKSFNMDLNKSHSTTDDSEDTESSRPQMRTRVKLMKLLKESCPDMTVSLESGFEDYIMLVEESGTSAGNPPAADIAVFADPTWGELIHADSYPSINEGIKSSCAAIRKHKSKQRQSRQ